MEEKEKRGENREERGEIKKAEKKNKEEKEGEREEEREDEEGRRGKKEEERRGEEKKREGRKRKERRCGKKGKDGGRKRGREELCPLGLKQFVSARCIFNSQSSGISGKRKCFNSVYNTNKRKNLKFIVSDIAKVKYTSVIITDIAA